MKKQILVCTILAAIIAPSRMGRRCRGPLKAFYGNGWRKGGRGGSHLVPRLSRAFAEERERSGQSSRQFEPKVERSDHIEKTNRQEDVIANVER